MKKNDLILISEYLNIISILIEKYKFTSLIKVEIAALTLYYQRVIKYNNKKNNRIRIFFENLHYNIIANSMDFIAITEVINILENNGYIEINNDIINQNKPLNFELIDIFNNKNISIVLMDIAHLSTNSFVKEVIDHV